MLHLFLNRLEWWVENLILFFENSEPFLTTNNHNVIIVKLTDTRFSIHKSPKPVYGIVMPPVCGGRKDCMQAD
jgi:hypothetical protein